MDATVVEAGVGGGATEFFIISLTTRSISWMLTFSLSHLVMPRPNSFRNSDAFLLLEKPETSVFLFCTKVPDALRKFCDTILSSGTNSKMSSIATSASGKFQSFESESNFFPPNFLTSQLNIKISFAIQVCSVKLGFCRMSSLYDNLGKRESNRQSLLRERQSGSFSLNFAYPRNRSVHVHCNTGEKIS